MDRNIFKYIYRHSKKQQILILILTLISFPFLYYSLELPKLIVNEAIGGEMGPSIEVLGYTFDQIEYLFLLSGIFLALVCVNGAFKYYINVYRGVVGERVLRRLRYELYTRVLRFRLPRFKKMSQGEIIPMITAEVEPIGGFVGDAFALPAYQGGTLLVYLAFIFVQDPYLGAAAISLYPLQGYLIPKLQKRVNQLGKERVRNVRALSDRIGETVSGTQEIHGHDTSNVHMADVSHRLGNIFDIRLSIYKRKFFIKFLNNFLNQLTPFFFYSIGGYLVIVGDLSFGALVAVLAAYKDLSGPWRELLNYYQRTEDVRIKYEQVIEQFQPDDIMPADHLTADPSLEGPLPQHLSLSNVTYAEDEAVPKLDGLSLTLDTTRHTAILGDGNSGKDELLMLLARLLVPTQGRIRLGDHDFVELPEAVTGRRFAYVGPSSHMFTDSLRNNLYYGLKHRPLQEVGYEGDEAAWRRRRISEALASGNITFDVQADWIDYAAAGAGGPRDLEERALQVLRAVDLDRDVYRMGLNSSVDPAMGSEIADKVLEARGWMARRLADPALGEPVELFDVNRFNTNASVAENVLFGMPVGDTFSLDRLADHPHMQRVLAEVGLTGPFLEIGASVAETMIELFADLPPDHEFFEQFSFISADDLPVFQPIVARVKKEGVEALKEEDRRRLLALPFKLIPSRHRLGLIDEAMQERIVAARHFFARELPDALRDAVEFFDWERYNRSASLQDNLLFGKVRYGQAAAMDTVQHLIEEAVDNMGLRRLVVSVGLDHSVGVAGARLSTVQRQKLALGRALLRQPDVLILNEATGGLDSASQAVVHGSLRTWLAGKGLIWAPHRPALARTLDEIVVLKDGRVAARGSYEDLAGQEGEVGQLLEAE
ncbi:MAG: ATP-binding cassette domain-containing protein [Alphaproteobacteria bacterium]|jgi:ABC-type bacteriocin/lantibiotic exporter with double-glycine peptidase domain|nr:ATP-binding cassette domain-containing protein [Alphaproteobacteria bacterium]